MAAACNAGCLNPDQTGQGAWSYVGKTKGGYERLQELSYVGNGAGSFEKKEVTTVTGWRLKKGSAATALFIVLVVVLCCGWGWSKLSVEKSHHAVAQESPPALRSSLHEPAKLTSEASAGIAAARPLPYDCWEGKEDWKESWIEAKKEWCCKHEMLGCRSTVDDDATATESDAETEAAVPDGAVAIAVGPQASQVAAQEFDAPQIDCDESLRATWGRAQREWCAGRAKATPAPDPASLQLGDCEAPCSLGGRTATCKTRIQSVADYYYAGRADACSAALKAVHQVCSACKDTCTLPAAGCTLALPDNSKASSQDQAAVAPAAHAAAAAAV